VADGWISMLDVREIGRAFVLADCGTIHVVSLFMPFIKAIQSLRCFHEPFGERTNSSGYGA
jgi:hypothetical protein